MRKPWVMLLSGLLVGCEYTVPLVSTPQLEIDQSVVGLWQRPKENGQTEQLLVLPLGPNEYLVSYPAGVKESMFARACLCRVAEQTLVQLRWFGTAQADIPDDNRVFQFASYSVAGNRLTVSMLNSEVIKKDVASTDELVKAITANKDNPNLFRDTLVFTNAASSKVSN